MKKFYTISVFAVLVFLANYTYASTNDENTNDPNSAIIAKENLVSDNAEEPVEKQESTTQEPLDAQPSASPQIKDSTNINSVCKFNYIFYFIYKLKYDENDNATGYIEYEF